ncbi:M1 family metallopeptidase [Planomicrobium sp. CPCC 101079]|uniref:M1 family metallopeptidase n=1 Tax=Planomicrobium sp. CPCC 101079 TaxID=2599618 RepID=UPI0011B575DB|nr:M1 family metallopeptidase [Planomicrobium sp. CPCC 101079]TWT08912.1 M1 family metallopeptidase [Planomicrobium sp. CPCC 101079]
MSRKKSWLIGIVVTVIVSIGLLTFVLPQMKTGPEEGELDPEASASYGLKVVLDEEGQFQITAEIDIVNHSEDVWETIGFYFIPNANDEEVLPELIQDPADSNISSITNEAGALQYELTNNKLLVQLDEEMQPGEKQLLKIVYTMSLSEDGIRLSRNGNNYYLAQWYPMLAFYQDGWTIEDFDPKGESYHTSYSDFTVEYELPGEFYVATSADDGKISPSSSGTVQGENIKDFYMALMDPEEWTTETRQANDTTLRMFLPVGSDITEETAELAVDAYSYFEEKIGDNPFQELDIIANDGYMEYPNAIEVASDKENLESVLVHEIGHQWFYFLVANDPFEHAWVDESITEYATALFLEDRYDSGEYGFESAVFMAEYYDTNKFSNLPLDEYGETEYYATIYGKTPLILRDFFDGQGREEAFGFLAAYYKEYQFQNVDTETFKRFFNEYFGEDHSGFFEDWLQ